ncbi:MAG: putative HTH-type transcriptional regulator YurK [Lentisphaerae bacterium ADurb.Bin242]|nr:MAG: putative HTH-type transcriptional regulator YurK [Lentisphaerae bacterium ADurb.Bin242]
MADDSKNAKVFQPLYMTVMQDVIKKIHDGFYRPGAKLPSVRKLAKKYDVSYRVIHYAFGELATQNYLYTEPKRGIFVNPELKTGRFYRIGFLYLRINPMVEGEMAQAIYRCAYEHLYETILLSNYRSDENMIEKIKQYPHFDGFLVSGILDEKFLRELQQFHVPYVVLGNYHISPEHPQVRVDILNQLSRKLLEYFRPFKGKKIAALMGDPRYEADRESIQALRTAVAEAGAFIADELIATAGTDGYLECCELMKQQPDVLYIHGTARSGYRKYRLLKPEGKHPYVICNYPLDHSLSGNLYDGIFDQVIRLNLGGCSVAVRATEKLLELINQRSL